MLAFIACIAFVFLSFLPIFDGTISYSHIFTVIIGLLNAIRMVEFLFILTPGQWDVWLLGTYMLHLLSFIGFNYDELMDTLKKASETGENS